MTGVSIRLKGHGKQNMVLLKELKSEGVKEFFQRTTNNEEFFE